MDKYEQISIIGEGSYGIVLKCRHKETDQLVAIKKFLETEDDQVIRKLALREIRLLKKLRHENLVTMIDVFRYRKRFCLVFEYLDGTILDELERHPGGLDEEICRDRIYQVVRAVHYCHSNQIIHRDVKPENVLVSSQGVVKLCDFGFARLITSPSEQCTDYVATRWYRAPELLIGETNYGGSVDIWAIGCLFSEIMTGDPLFPGESDIDQLYLIVQMLGEPCERHQQLMLKNSQLRNMVIKKESNNNDKSSSSLSSLLAKHFPNWSIFALDFLSDCLKMDPIGRATTNDLLKSNYFLHDRFPQRFLPQLRDKVNIAFNNNPLIRKYKTEILIATTIDKKDDSKTKKLPQNLEQVRWRFILTPEENCMKRKYELSSDNNNNNNDNLITLSKTSQRLNVVQQQSTNTTNNKQSQKAVQQNVVIKFNNNNNRKIMANSPILPSTPSIHLNYNRDLPKRSPNLLQSSSMFTKQIPQQHSSIIVKHYTKKLDRTENCFETTTFNNFVGNNQQNRKKEFKCKSNLFTLPNLPGVASSSPINKNTGYNNNNKKKSLPELDLGTSTTVTPRIQSSTSSLQNHSPTKTYNNNSSLLLMQNSSTTTTTTTTPPPNPSCSFDGQKHNNNNPNDFFSSRSTDIRKIKEN